ncbi:RsmB/NOP family class I SAM-dependent RNA methyltransferase [Thermodesulforhabdus norvegica]|uniref:NOL1/NOP2/sun family putative RNA methylase n=1 Tax=Thermodesulforhabdus norvegica TaxID=39841 RepID=A0A1I4R6Q0_9BACT|nr:RsmB/NOP family class I SAM-dependent RNA methyltransferase [Thermodesulforhabdus norvegica]SFM47972.1 NOL1/NOP2/sun family putative RNA methylase [Thermodesulforhabdus norvegica]
MMEFLERYRDIVDDWPAFLHFSRKPLKSGVWVNLLKTEQRVCERLLQEAGIDFEPLRWCRFGYRVSDPGAVVSSWFFLVGLCHVQDVISLVPVILLDPQPGESVLDLCAAPGNKTSFAAMLMKNSGRIVANDMDTHRLGTAMHLCARLGVVTAVFTKYNGASYPYSGMIGDAGFDRILVDAPCSGEGTTRKNPSGPGWCDKDFSLRMSRLQKALLERAVRLCKPGGRIVYSTCTYAPEENEEVVDHVLRVFDGLISVIDADLPGLVCSEGIDSWEGRSFDRQVRKCLRIWPHQNDTGGFFVAVLEKSGDREYPRGSEKDPALVRWKKDEVCSWMSFLEKRFEIDTTAFDAYQFYRGNKKRVHVIKAEKLGIPGFPVPLGIGMPFLKDQGAVPKLTTAASMYFGAMIRKNAVDLSREQLGAYFRREEVTLTKEQISLCDGRGYVLVRHRGVPCGLAMLKSRGSEIWYLESLFPAGWAKAYGQLN